MMELLELALETKHCPICSQLLPLTEFGICRARKDGRNLYCRGCIRKKVTESRRAFKAYKSIRDQYPTSKILEPDRDAAPNHELNNDSSSGHNQYASRQPNRMTPAERVREAIRKGARTQKDIAQATKLGKDEIGDALANLLLWTREIRTEVIENARQYFINVVAAEPVFGADESYTANLPPRKRDVPSSFSAVPVLMPGKKPQGEPEKLGSWFAA
jgi:hypothetical protein